MKNIAIIPARIGSKGLPDKKIKNLAGNPLIAYSIEAAIILTSEKLFLFSLVNSCRQKLQSGSLFVMPERVCPALYGRVHHLILSSQGF